MKFFICPKINKINKHSLKKAVHRQKGALEMNDEYQHKQNLRQLSAIGIQTVEMTKEVFVSAVRGFLEGHSPEKSGETTLKKLQEQSGGNLENIRVTDQNIGSFTETARKYDIDYALKRDKSTEPPTWYVFFKTNEKRRDTLNRAMTEYTAVALGNSDKRTAITTPEKVHQIDRKVQENRKIKPPVRKRKRNDRDI
jgi:hypothetical protein